MIYLSALVVLSSIAEGATFRVDVLRDTVDATPGDGVCSDTGGGCSLRAAVMETNALVGSDIVELPAGGHVLTAAGLGESGEDLDVLDDLLIQGAGRNATWVSGMEMYRIFYVSGAPLTLMDLSLVDAAVPIAFGNDGGAIYANADVALHNVGIFNASAWTAAAVLVDGGGLDLEDVIVENCYTPWGPVLWATGDSTMTRVRFAGNTADRSGSTLLRVDGNLQANNAILDGHPDHVMLEVGGDLDATNVVFEGLYSGARVGGFTTIRDVRAYNNYEVVSSEGGFLVEDSVFARNAGAIGGSYSGPVEVRRSRMLDTGGGVYVGSDEDVIVEDCVFANNEFAGVSVSLRSDTATATIRNNTFVGNGSAIEITGPGTATVEDNDVVGSVSPYMERNPAVRVDGDADVTFRRLVVRGSVDGGGMEVRGNSIVTIEDSLFEENTVRALYYWHLQRGSAIDFEGDTLTVRDTAFLGNSNPWDSGTLYVDEGDLVLERCSFSENEAVDGAGVAFSGVGRATMTDVTFLANVATAGSIVSNGGPISMARVSFVGNTADNAVRANNVVRMTNVTVANNTLNDPTGALDLRNTSTLNNVTVTGNSTTSADVGAVAGMYVAASAEVNVSNSLIAGNTDATGAPADCDGALISLGSNLLGEADACFGLDAADVAGTRAAPLDPLVGPPTPGLGATALVPLRPGSPAIDAGGAVTACALDDQRGVLRPVDGDADGTATCDIGAYEADAP